MNICRLCLTTEKEKMHPFDESFVMQYNLLTNLNVTLMDGMPQFSCESCLHNVKYFIEFREKSIESETTIRELFLTGVKSEKETGLQIEVDPKIEDDNLNAALKYEIKCEKDDDFDITFEEYDGDIRSLVKSEDVKPKRIKKKKKKKLSVPIQSNVNSDKWFCGICPEVFEDKDKVKIHLEIHKNDRECELCKEKMNSTSQLYAHRLRHVPQKQLNCHICSKRFRCCIYLEHHYRNIHIESDDNNLFCSLCATSYSTPKKYNSHMTYSHSSNRFICDVCSQCFSNKTNLKSHIQRHKIVKSYVCDLCGFSCNYSGGLKDHKVRRHSEQKINCKNCTRAFSSQYDYDRHNCKVRLRICPICGVQIKGGSKLSRHLSSHSDVHRYKCDRCPAKYKTKGALIAHKDKHDGNRTKQCEYCPAKFYTTSVLIKHRRIHTGEKPYVCKVCDKAFTGGHNLKIHMQVHGEYLVVKKNAETDILEASK